MIAPRPKTCPRAGLYGGTTDRAFDGWLSVVGDVKMTIAQFVWFTHHCGIVETGTGSWRQHSQL